MGGARVFNGDWLPDKLGRIFHPQKYGHMLMAYAAKRALDDDKVKRLGMPKAPIIMVDQCPANSGPATHAGIHGKCYSDEPSGDHVSFTVTDIQKAIRTFCRSHAHDKALPGNGMLTRLPNGENRKE